MELQPSGGPTRFHGMQQKTSIQLIQEAEPHRFGLSDELDSDLLHPPRPIVVSLDITAMFADPHKYLNDMPTANDMSVLLLLIVLVVLFPILLCISKRRRVLTRRSTLDAKHLDAAADCWGDAVDLHLDEDLVAPDLENGLNKGVPISTVPRCARLEGEIRERVRLMKTQGLRATARSELCMSDASFDATLHLIDTLLDECPMEDCQLNREDLIMFEGDFVNQKCIFTENAADGVTARFYKFYDKPARDVALLREFLALVEAALTWAADKHRAIKMFQKLTCTPDWLTHELGFFGMVTMAANGGDCETLVTYDANGNVPFSEMDAKEARKLIRMLAFEMEALGNAGILHLDIKLKNVVYHKDSNRSILGVSLIDYAEGRWAEDYMVTMPKMGEVQLYHRTPYISNQINPEEWGFEGSVCDGRALDMAAFDLILHRLYLKKPIPSIKAVMKKCQQSRSKGFAEICEYIRKTGW